MSLFGYKDYQNRAIDALRDYFREIHSAGANIAFYKQTRRAYNEVEALPGLPYVCLRIPTGGGKTVLACRAVPLAAQELLQQERSVVLWLVPTNTIKDQTLAALRNPRHPYRQTLDAELKGDLTVLDLAEALAVQRATLDGSTAIIVSTLAALRVEDTTGRKVYEQNGSLMSHFDGLPAHLATAMERPANGAPVYSLCNVLRLRRPVVIMDEAHNARTPLSFTTLARFQPSCIVELTATPDTQRNPSNVLYHVSAAELKAEGMIKLPIQLETHGDALAALAAAKARRELLEAQTGKERQATGEYIRPIVLIQAETQGDEFTPARVKKALLDMGLPEAQIAIETGAQSELGDTDLFAEDCPVRYILTVDKLREGWDCSFAYVLCSVRNMRAHTAVEQILGRVLRMPQAVRKQQDSLNHAYAIVTSQGFARAAQTLTDALTNSGFTAYEIPEAIQQTVLPLGGVFGAQPSAVPAPAEKGEKFQVPQLALWVEGEPEPVDETHFLQGDWNLADEQAELSEAEFALQQTAQAIEIDVSARGKLETRYIADVQMQLSALLPDDILKPTQLAVWLDRHIRHDDISQTQSQLFLLRLVHSLIEQRGLDLRMLSRQRLRLRDAAAKKIDEYRQKHRERAYQQLLFEQPPVELQVSAERVFTFDPDNYPVNARYEGTRQFSRHYYRAIGDMNSEEADCAWLLDRLPKVKFWVRNLERRPESSFWLPTLTDRFYPDFVAQLEDGRILAVEYKGAHLLTGDDTKEKQQIGELWEARSNGQCLFMLVGQEDFGPRLQSLAA